MQLPSLLGVCVICMQKNIKSMLKFLQKITTKKKVAHFFAFLFLCGIFFGSYEGALAQGSSLADVCGQGASTTTACKVGDIGPLVKGLLSLVLSIGLPLLFIFVAYRFVVAWFALQQGNAGAYKDALKKAGNAIFGFIIIVFLIGGGLYTVFSIFGVKPEILKILKLFSQGGLITPLYAEQLPNFLIADNLYDFILNALRLAMKFFIYPALIVLWVWTGFAFVLAQGAPDALIKAKKWLVGALVSTIVILVLQGFLLALRSSVLKILGTSETSQVGKACVSAVTGKNGRIGTDGKCY